MSIKASDTRRATWLLIALLSLAPAGWGESPSLQVPRVDWERVDPAAREVLLEQQARVDDLLAMGDPGDDELALAYGEAGMHYHAFGFSSAARACYVNAGRLTPGDWRWPYYLGHLYGDGETASGGLHEAAAQFERVLSIHPNHLPSLVALGKLSLTLGRPDDAGEAYHRARLINPDNAAANLGLGRVLMAEGRHEQALVYLERAEQSQPDVRTIHYALAMTYRALGDSKRARAHLERGARDAVTVDDPLMSALRSVRTGAPALIREGSVLLRADRVEEALSVFARAAQLDPDNASAWLNLGATRLILQDFAGAVGDLARAVELAPGNSTAHYNLGVAYALRGLEPAAIRHLSEAISLHPGYARGHQQLGDALARAGQYERALSHYERSAELSPGQFLPRFRHAMMLVRLGRTVSSWSWS